MPHAKQNALQRVTERKTMGVLSRVLCRTGGGEWSRLSALRLQTRNEKWSVCCGGFVARQKFQARLVWLQRFCVLFVVGFGVSVPRCATRHAPDTASSRQNLACVTKIVSWRAAVQVVRSLRGVSVQVSCCAKGLISSYRDKTWG